MSAPDYHEVIAIEKRMKEAARKLHDMESEMAMALVVIARDKDNMKGCLARYQIKHVKAGESAASSEILARADPEYEKEVKGYNDVLTIAVQTKLAYENEKTSWETARSLLARQRVTMDTIPETEA